MNLSRFTKKSLPKNFAESVMNLEIEVELNEVVQIDIFQELIQLYMIGVEYYESIKDRKHIYFQRKLNTLMTKPQFMMATQNPQNKKEKFETTVETTVEASQTKQITVKGMVENLTQSVQKIEGMIKQEMATQDDKFNKRLESRRRSRLTHSQSQPSMNLEQMIQQKPEQQVIIEEDDQIKISEQDQKWKQIKLGLHKNKQRTNSIQNNKRLSEIIQFEKKEIRGKSEPIIKQPLNEQITKEILNSTLKNDQLEINRRHVKIIAKH
ncbi:hypothetical protein pb186bvf_001006 [Paramecium bursaria]